MYSTQRLIEAERKRIKEREAEQRVRFIQGLFLAPIFLLGPFIILWLIIIVSK
jgi:cobalamin biosynthesis protein CobD/CbiB